MFVRIKGRLLTPTFSWWIGQNYRKIDKMPTHHRYLECSMCKKVMRSDNLKRHWKSKHRTSDIELTITVKHRSNIDGGPSTDNDLKSEMITNDMLFAEKINLGKNIYNLLRETNTKE